MMAKPYRSKVREYLLADVEREQALLRVALLTLTTLYLWIMPQSEPLFPFSPRLIALAYLPLAIGLVVRILAKPGTQALRKIAFTILDQAAIFAAVYPAGNGIPIIALAFWVMVGSGFRFGKAYLYLSAWAAVVGMGFCIAFSPHWANHVIYGWAFMASYLTVAFYTTVLLARVSETNARLNESLSRVSALARNDHLTGLPNRLAFVERLTQSIAMAQRTEVRLSLLYIDIDGFKAVNDTLGHNQGDELLKQVAQRLKSNIRSTDMLARVGGDEFIIVLEGSRLPPGAPRVAQMILDSVEAIDFRGTQSISGKLASLRVGASIGITSYEPTMTPAPPRVETFIKQADEAMYAAKKAGKGCYRFSPEHAAASPESDDSRPELSGQLRT